MMFRQRTSSQKPDDELLANFRQQFPEVAVPASTAGSAGPIVTNTIVDTIVPATMPGQERTQNIHQPVFPDQDPTPRASGNEPWRFTPSLLDPNSFSFSGFPHNPTGFYTSAPGAPGAPPNPAFQSQPGDLHNPALALAVGINAPLSMPAANAALHPHDPNAPMVDLGAAGFANGGLHPQVFNSFANPFVHAAPTQPAFAPHGMMHHNGAFGPMDHTASPLDPTHPSVVTSMAAAPPGLTSHGGFAHFPPRQIPQQSTFPATNTGAVTNIAMLSLPPSAEKFRFHTTLNAPTAMVKQADEIPISYLNKGQAYSLSIIDSEPELPIVRGTRFRTYVRVSFEDEQQRQKPGVCWSLWKEGRGTSEAHHRGGKLQAVEYVEAGQPPEGDEKRTRVELENASFDGFSVIWTPGLHGTVECNIAVRFNFLSTDFSHSKGVKGIPVRLCAKTTRYPMPQQLPPQPSQTASPGDATSSAPAAEICFCKVKLFRDHGAERKLSNDVAHVKKTIDKLKQQIAQAESGMKDFGKRKRSGGAVAAIAAQQSKAPDLQRAGKVPKHKRTWSMSSNSSGDGGPRTGDVTPNGTAANGTAAGVGSNGLSAGAGVRLAVEEDLHCKLQNLQDMFTSTRPVSILYLRGDDLDDPDLHPVSLPGEPADFVKVESRDNLLSSWRDQSGRSSVAGSSMVSPSPSSMSLHSQVSATNGTSNSVHWTDSQVDLLGPHHASVSRQGSDQPTKITKMDDTGKLTGWIEALGVDPLYRQPPASDRPKPVVCFYVIRRTNQVNGNGNANLLSAESASASREYHRAVYLMKRTVPEFVARIAAKWKLDASRVVRTVRVLPQGLEIELDDDVLAELPDGQDMVLDVVGAPPSSLQRNLNGHPTEKEWEMALDSDETAYELRLSF